MCNSKNPNLLNNFTIKTKHVLVKIFKVWIFIPVKHWNSSCVSPVPLRRVLCFYSTYTIFYLFSGDIYDEVTAKELAPKKLDSECLGGGRIQHDAAEKKIKVYGYSQVSLYPSLNFLSERVRESKIKSSQISFSQGFGRADHAVSVDLLKKIYGDYSISWSDEGY